MKQPWSDRIWASAIALALLSIACYAVFGFQHGFEEQVAWYLVLLPGSILAAPISDLVTHRNPNGRSVSFDVLIVCFSFIWYFALTYSAIRTYRFISKFSKNA